MSKDYVPATMLDIVEWERRHQEAMADFRDPVTGASLARASGRESPDTASRDHGARGPISRTCEGCGRVFEARRVDARFCCDAHRKAARRERVST